MQSSRLHYVYPIHSCLRNTTLLTYPKIREPVAKYSSSSLNTETALPETWKKSKKSTPKKSSSVRDVLYWNLCGSTDILTGRIHQVRLIAYSHRLTRFLSEKTRFRCQENIETSFSLQIHFFESKTRIILSCHYHQQNSPINPSS